MIACSTFQFLSIYFLVFSIYHTMPFCPLFLPFHCHLFLQRETITTSQAYAADLSSRLALLEKEKVEAEVKARSAKDDMMKMKADVDREQRRAERANDEMMYTKTLFVLKKNINLVLGAREVLMFLKCTWYFVHIHFHAGTPSLTFVFVLKSRRRVGMFV